MSVRAPFSITPAAIHLPISRRTLSSAIRSRRNLKRAIPRPLRDEQYAEDTWADALLRERSLLYVAATRTRDELALSWSGDPSQLLPPAADQDLS